MKQVLLEYAFHNLWANKKIVDTISSLPSHVPFVKVKSSFDSIYSTMLHIWVTQVSWMQRLEGKKFMSTENKGTSISEVNSSLINSSRIWCDWIENSTVDTLQKLLNYENSNNEQFVQPIFQIALHVFNHSTHHRGQLVTILRQLEIEHIPATDFIIWTREMNNSKSLKD